VKGCSDSDVTIPVTLCNAHSEAQCTFDRPLKRPRRRRGARTREAPPGRARRVIAREEAKGKGNGAVARPRRGPSRRRRRAGAPARAACPSGQPPKVRVHPDTYTRTPAREAFSGSTLRTDRRRVGQWIRQPATGNVNPGGGRGAVSLRARAKRQWAMATGTGCRMRGAQRADASCVRARSALCSALRREPGCRGPTRPSAPLRASHGA
jgi:hypothetical protein